MLYKVTGRGFVPDAFEEQPESAEAEEELGNLARLDEPGEIAEETSSVAEPDAPVEASLDDVAQALNGIEPAIGASEPVTADAEAVERVSRYNFDELSRILNDRVGDRAGAERRAQPDSAGLPAEGRQGALINLGGETLVLNRLPLGILVFRDQQVLFANRAITEMVGYESVETLRNAGLAAIFPAAGPEGQEAGTGQPSGAARWHAGAGDGAAAVDFLAGTPCPDAVGQHDRSAHRP